jgi:hypothetical protein
MNRLLKAAIPALMASAFATGSIAQAPRVPAQVTPEGTQAQGPQARGAQRHERGGSMKPAERAEARLAYVKTALKITPAQEPQWNAYANFIRKTAGDMEQRFQRRSEGGQRASASRERPNAVQRLERQQQMHAAANKRLGELLAVQKPLYDVLSAEQKKIADEVLSPRGRGRPMHAGFRRG